MLKSVTDMDVLLINPQNIRSRSFGITPPAGLAFIGGVLEKEGFSVKILDLELRPPDFDLYAYIKSLLPKVVGISGTSHSRFESFRIAGIVKHVSHEIFTVYGGSHATFTAEDTLYNIEEIDYIVHGEGEETLLELVNHLILKKKNIEGVRGISYRKAGKVVKNAARLRIQNLDVIPHGRNLLEMEKYRITVDGRDTPAATILTARGCPYNCSFCSASSMFGKTYTMRSAKNIVDEIEYAMQKSNIRGIRFFDSTLTLNKWHILSIINELKARHLSLEWSCEIRIGTIDKSLLKAMKESGCRSVDFGVESVSENVLKGIGKNFTTEEVRKVLKWCKGLNLRTVVFFSFGHIGEGWEDSKKTVSFIDRYFDYITIVSEIFGIRIYPGTAVEKYARKNGFLPPDFSWSRPFKNIAEGPIVTDNVPILLQPSYGIRELRKAHDSVARIRSKKMLRLKIVRAKLREIKSGAALFQKTKTALKLAVHALFNAGK